MSAKQSHSTYQETDTSTKAGQIQDELIAQAAAADVAVYPTGKYCADPDHHPDSVVLIGFSSIAEADIRPGIEALARAWFG